MLRLAVGATLLVAVAALSPNDKLKKCCSTIAKGDKECVNDFCDFNAISQTNILNFLSTCSDKGPTLGMMWDCASLRHNHKACCEKAGVQKECLVYCTAEKGVPTNYLDYLFCTESFDQIKTCFHDHLEKNPAYDHKHPKV